MKYKVAEKDETTITNSEEYKRLNMNTSNDVEVNVCLSDANSFQTDNLQSPTKTTSPRRSKIVIPSAPSRRVLAVTTEEPLILKLRTTTFSPKSCTVPKKKASPTNMSLDVSEIDASLETKLSLETINQFLEKIPQTERNVPLASLEIPNVSTILRSMSFIDISQHLRSLRTDYIVRFARPIVTKLMQHPKNMKVFNKPVDLKLLPSYQQIVKYPIDLGTILSRLQMGSHYYESLDACFRDVQRVFDNALLFNPAQHVVHKLAADLKRELLADMQSCLDRCLKEIERKKQHSCSFCCGCECHLCGEKCLKFEPSVQICHGSCGQRIKKNSLYYLSVDSSYLWCYKCYNNLPSVIIDSASGDSESNRLLKKDLIRRKSDEEIAEAWVECDTCGYWIHQVCALYDDFESPTSRGQNNLFQCPLCVLQMHSERTNSAAGELVSNIVGDSESEVSGGHLVRRGRKKATTGAKNAVSKNIKRFEVVISNNSSAPISDSSPCGTLVNTVHSSIEMKGASQVGSEAVTDSPHDDCDKMVLAHEVVSVSDSGEEMDSISNISDGPLIQSADSCANTFSATNSVVIEVEDGDSVAHGVEAECSPDRLSVESNRCESEREVDTDDTQIWKSSALPRTNLSDFLENAVSEMLLANGFGDVASTITIRLCSNRDHKMEVPRAIIDNMMTASGDCIPEFLAYRQKCILLFQKIDGIDVCLFCLYVHEFDDSCPAPNTSTVYIAYLDSVNYFRPSEARTMVYQEVVIGYLQWAQARGFKQGHIWSCPPQRGDNFIFNSHPSHQKTPSRERLNSWYNSILIRASQLGILSDIGTLSDKYFLKYAKRDENPQRLAARNSFVSTLKASNSTQIKAKVKSTSEKKKIPKRSVVAVATATNGDDSAASAITISRSDSIDIELPQPESAVASRTSCIIPVPGTVTRSITEEGDLASSVDENSTPVLQSENFLRCDVLPLSTPLPLQVPLPSEQFFQTTSSLMESVMSEVSVPVPICPPIFEGDLWVMEWVKASRSAASRSKGGSGKDKATNSRRIKELLRSIMFKTVAAPFNQPVDPEALNLPTYRALIERPMDLGTIKDNLRNGLYANMGEFYNDVTLTFENAMKFNPKGHYIHSNAELLLVEVRKGLISIVADFVEVDADGENLDSILAQFPLAAVSSDPGLTSPRDRSSSFAGGSSSSLCSLVSDAMPTSPLPVIMSPSAGNGDSALSVRSARKRKACRSVTSEAAVPSESQNAVPSSQNFFGGDYFDLQLSQNPDSSVPISRTVSVDGCYDGEKCPEDRERDRDRDRDRDSCMSDCHEARQQHERRVSQSQALLNDAEIEAARNFSAHEFNLRHVPKRFSKPASSPKALATMLQELCKSVQRLNDDLFVFKFAPVLSKDSSRFAIVEGGGQGANVEECGSKDCTVKSKEFNPLYVRGKLHKGRAQAFLKRMQQQLTVTSTAGNGLGNKSLSLPVSLLRLDCENIELDNRMISPLVDSRHSFLETCQFRHYQFDSLRRAQHSSLMILYHLHKPFDMRTRPTCHYCAKPIRHLRWHCDQCPNFECCQNCYELAAQPLETESQEESSRSQQSQQQLDAISNKRIRLEDQPPSSTATSEIRTVLPQHEHPLTPFRVSFF